MSRDSIHRPPLHSINRLQAQTNTDARTSAVKAVERTIGEAYEIVSVHGG